MKKRTKSKLRAKRPMKKAVLPRRTVVAKAPAKAPVSDTFDDFITAGAQNLGLKVEKSWMKAVRFNLRVTLDQAALMADFPLPDDAEPAPVFRA